MFPFNIEAKSVPTDVIEAHIVPLVPGTVFVACLLLIHPSWWAMLNAIPNISEVFRIGILLLSAYAFGRVLMIGLHAPLTICTLSLVLLGLGIFFALRKRRNAELYEGNDDLLWSGTAVHPWLDPIWRFTAQRFFVQLYGEAQFTEEVNLRQPWGGK